MVQEYTEFIKSEILSTILPCNGIPNKWELYVYTSVKDKFTDSDNCSGNYTIPLRRRTRVRNVSKWPARSSTVFNFPYNSHLLIIWLRHPFIYREKFAEIKIKFLESIDVLVAHNLFTPDFKNFAKKHAVVRS